MTSTKVTVNLTSKTRMEQALKKAGVENPASITKLTVIGKLTLKDFWHLEYVMAETLEELDLSRASVEDNEIERFFFDCFTSLTSLVLPEKFPWGIYDKCKDLTYVAMSGLTLHNLLFDIKERESSFGEDYFL